MLVTYKEANMGAKKTFSSVNDMFVSLYGSMVWEEVGQFLNRRGEGRGGGRRGVVGNILFDTLKSIRNKLKCFGLLSPIKNNQLLNQMRSFRHFLTKNETLPQVFSCGFLKIFKNTFSYRTLLVGGYFLT